MSANPQKENGYTAIANEILEALARIRINGEARQMLDVIIRKTYGFNKKQDRISTSQFVEATGLPNYAIHKARHKLLKVGIIEVLPKKVTGITQKGNSQVLTYSFQKDYTKWQPLPKKVTVTQKGNELYPKKVTNCTPKSDTQKTIYKRQYTKDIQDFFSFFLLKTKKAFKLTLTNRNLIRQRLNDGYTIEQMKQAVDNFVQDEWADRQKHLDLVYCIGIRNKIDNLEKWLNIKPKKTEFKPEPQPKFDPKAHDEVSKLIHETAEKLKAK